LRPKFFANLTYSYMQTHHIFPYKYKLKMLSTKKTGRTNLREKFSVVLP
jgi:hypothetical protein